MEKRIIIYISGEGFSGSTLLDILLGSQENAFSSGELIFFAQKGIKNKEYCACGNPVPECEVWSKVIEKWNKTRNLSLDEYIQLQNKLTSKKNFLRSYFSLKSPSGTVKYFLEDTSKLYDIIFEITDSKIIIDSSKAPERIMILKKLINYDIKVVHLVRRFGDVLNSYKKTAEKNLKAGVEHDMFPLNSFYVFSSWSFKNLFTSLYSRDISYQKIKYDQLVLNPKKELSTIINDDSTIDKLQQRGPFYPEHLVAGNQMRMKDHIFIAEKPMNTSYHRLNRRNKLFAKFIDLFY